MRYYSIFAFTLILPVFWAKRDKWEQKGGQKHENALFSLNEVT